MPDIFNRRNYLIMLVLVFISMLILTIHFREGENGPIHRIQRFLMAVTAPAQSIVTTALQPVSDGWEYLTHFGDLKRENRELRSRVDQLQGELNSLEAMKKENERLQALIGFKNQLKQDVVAAHVIGMPASNWWSSIVLDKGSEDGVKQGMPVASGGGLVGQIVDVSQHASKVVLLNDAQSGVSVQLERTGEVGILKGQMKNQRLSLKYISRDSTVMKDDLVLTSGLGEVFPKGLYVGKVVSVKQSDYSLYKVVEVEPTVDFLTLEDVLIVKREPGFSFKEGN